MNQIKKAANWLLPPITLLPFRAGYRDSRDAPPAWHVCRLLASSAVGAVLALACRIVYRFVAQVGISIVVDEQVAHHRGMLMQRGAA